jgi:hypothetical protein
MKYFFASRLDLFFKKKIKEIMELKGNKKRVWKVSQFKIFFVSDFLYMKQLLLLILTKKKISSPKFSMIKKNRVVLIFFIYKDINLKRIKTACLFYIFIYIKKTGMTNFKIRFLKTENFKSYKKFLFLGPLKNFFSIIGQNGSGKTNFFDSLIFGLGGTLEEINCYSIYNLFSQFFFKEIYYRESKIGLCFTNKNQNDFCRFTTIDNYSEFFLNGIKISFSNYKKSLKQLKIVNNKNFIVLKNLFNCPFFFPNFKLS